MPGATQAEAAVAEPTAVEPTANGAVAEPKEAPKAEPTTETPPPQETTPTPSKTGFAETKQTMTQGDFIINKTPLKEVKFSSGVQEQMHNIVISYDDATLARIAAAKDTGTYTPTQRDHAVSELRKQLKIRKDAGNQDLFYDTTEVTLAISVIEDLLIQEAAALAYKLTSGGTQEGQLTLPKKLTVEVRKPFRTRAGQAIKGPFEALGIRIKNAQGRTITFETSKLTQALTEAWISERIAKGKFLSNELSNQDRAEIIAEQQDVRYEIYKAIGLDLNQVDQLSMLDLGPENFDPAAGEQARNSLYFHNSVIDHLRVLLTEYKVNSITQLSEAQRIEVLLKAREQAAASVAIEIGKGILAEKQGKAKESTDVANLKNIANEKKAVKKGSDIDIQVQTDTVNQAQKATQDFDRDRETFKVLRGNEEGSLAQARRALDEARADHISIENTNRTELRDWLHTLQDYETSIADAQTQMDLLQRHIQAIRERATNESRDLTDREKEEINRAGNLAEARRTTLDQFRPLRDAARNHVTTIKNEIKTANKAEQTASAHLRELEAKDRELITKLGGVDEDDQIQRRADLLRRHAESQKRLKELQEGSPSEENKKYGDLALKLHSVVTEDYNKIFGLLASGEISLKDLADPRTGYETFLNLLWNRNTSHIIPLDQQEQLLSRFELAYQIAKHYGVDLSTNPNFNLIDQLRTEVRRRANEVSHLEKQEGVDPTILENARNAVRIATQAYQTNDIRNLSNQLLQEVLPQVLTRGRWKAIELAQKILEAKVKDAKEGFLLDPIPYEGARPVERPPTPQGPPKPEGTAETPLTKEPAGEIKIGDRKSVEHLVKRLGLEDEKLAKYRDPIIFHQDFAGINTEYAFMVKQEDPRGVLFIEGLKANEELYRRLPDTWTEAQAQGWSQKIIEHFYNTDEKRKNRQQINNEVIVGSGTFDSVERVLDQVTRHHLPEAAKGIKLAGFDFITSRNPQERLDLFANFPTTPIDIGGTMYNVSLKPDTGELEVVIPIIATGWPRKMGVVDFLTRVGGIPGVNPDEIERFKGIIGTTALDTLRKNI